MCAEPVVFPVVVLDVAVVVLVSVMLLEVAFALGVKVTVIDVGVVWLSVGAAGLANCGTVSVRDVDDVPVGEVENVVPSPIDVIVALYVSLGVSPVKRAVPDVLPLFDVGVDVVVFVSVMVLDVACGFGVKVTVMDVVVVWLKVGAAGLGNGVSASVTEEDGALGVDVRKFVLSPTEVTVASYVSPAVRPVKSFVPVVLPESGIDALVVRLFKIIVLDVAWGSGVKLTVIDVGVVWLALGAAGVANWGISRVTGDDMGPSDESLNVVPSPFDVTVAVYVSPVLSPVNENEFVTMPDCEVASIPPS
jgi:hypothetical protein